MLEVETNPELGAGSSNWLNYHTPPPYLDPISCFTTAAGNPSHQHTQEIVFGSGGKFQTDSPYCKNKEETICKKSENPGNLTGMSQKRGKMYSSQEWQITNVKD